MQDLSTRQLKSIRNILLLLVIIVFFAILRELSSLLLPLALAGLLTILNLPLVRFLQKYRIPRVLITLLVATVTIVVIVVIVSMIGGTVEQLLSDSSVLASQFMKKIDKAIFAIGDLVPGMDPSEILGQVYSVMDPSRISSVIKVVFGTLGNLGSSSLFFLIYYLILLSGSTGYHTYLDFVMGKDNATRKLWEQTEQSITTYMAIKTLISLGTGVLAWLICLLFGLEFALFWGFMAFILNYIPSIGSIIATALPGFMAIIQFDHFGVILGLILLLGISQFIIGSVIDPMIMGNRLSLNTVTVIFGLVFWGYIWGIPGMLLSVPLMVVLRLLLLRSDDFAIVARLMGVAEKPKRKRKSVSRFDSSVSPKKPRGKKAQGSEKTESRAPESGD